MRLVKRKAASLNKIRVVVVGNCQARPIAGILESLNSSIDITAVAIVHLLKPEQFSEYKEHFENADLIISQLVFDTYPCDFVRTNFLKSMYGSKVVSIVNLYFSGYTPDWFYIRIAGRGPLRGPMGDYHNRTILESWQEGLSVEEAAKRMDDPEHNRRYRPEIEKSLEQLRERELLVDVKVTDIIVNNFRKKRLFFTFNHPSLLLLREYTKQILKKAGISYKRRWFVRKMDEPLNQFIPLVNPGMELPDINIMKHQGVDYTFDEIELVSIGTKRRYSSEEIGAEFYRIYDSLGDKLGLPDWGRS